MDITFNNILTLDGDYSVVIEENPSMATGNRLMANIFQITFMTNLNDSLLSYGYGSDGINIIKTGYDANDPQSIASMLKVACDNTVLMMKADQNNIDGVPKTERIEAAYVDSVNKIRDIVYVKIRLVPEEYEAKYAEPGLIVTLPL